MSEPVRVFLGWDAPVLPRVARWLLAIEPHELGELVVVVSGRRSGRLLLSHLVASVEGGGSAGGADGEPHGFVPPRIVTPGALPELFYRPSRRIATRRERLLAWCAALEAAPAGALPGAGPSADVRARIALARDLVSAQDELGEEGLRLGEVQARAAAVLDAAGEGERWRALASLESAVGGLLERCGLADPTTARLEALAGEADGPGPAVVLCCVATSRSLERAFLARFAPAVTALVAAPEREAGLFDAWGSVDPRAWRRRRLTLARGSLVVASRPRDQAEVVGRLAAAALGETEQRAGAGSVGERPAREAPASGRAGGERCGAGRGGGERRGVTVGLADPTLAGVVGEAIAARGLAVHDAVGRPLVSSAPWRLLRAVGSYAETRTTRALALVLRQPDLERCLAPALAAAASASPPASTRELREAIERADWLTALDLYTSETGVETVTLPLPGDEAAATLVAAADAELLAVLGDGAALEPLAEWMRRIQIVLLRVYGDRELGGDLTDRAAIRSLARLGEELRAQAAAASAHGGGPRVRIGDAIDLLVAEVAGEPLAGASTPEAIELVGWLELPLDDAPRLMVAGLDESAATAALQGGLLEPALRRSLSLLDADALYARDLYFLELLASSREATFVTGRRGAQGEPLSPRRTLLAGSTPALVETVLAFWGDAAEGEEDPPAIDDLPSPAGARRGAFRPVLPAADAPLPDRLPVTAFRDYLACPYRFYLRHVLALRRVGDLPRELEPGDFGRLLHAVLGRFARSAAVASDDPDTIRRALEEVLADEVSRRSGGTPRVAVRLQLEQLRRRLRAFARWQAEQRQSGWSIVAEHSEARLEARLDVDGVPFVVVGRVDRVDRHPEQGFRLLDYKSAEQAVTPEQAHRAGRRGERRWIDLQLPLYHLMLRQQGLGGELRLAFVNLGHRLGADPLAPAEWNAADLAEAIRTAADVVRAVRARRFWPPGDPSPWPDGFEGLAGDAFPDRERYLRGA